jgi:hypothetical protein
MAGGRVSEVHGWGGEVSEVEEGLLLQTWRNVGSEEGVVVVEKMDEGVWRMSTKQTSGHSSALAQVDSSAPF